MSEFADIAFPTAVRRMFTYSVGRNQSEKLRPGMRVWVPFRNHNAIGVVVRLHNEKPDFSTKEIREILDNEPVINDELLGLCNWVRRFYYCSLGEVFQAVLPAGLNYVSKKYLRASSAAAATRLASVQKEIFETVRKKQRFEYNEALKRWQSTNSNKALKLLLKNGLLEVWEEPDLKVTVKTERAWAWADTKNAVAARQYINALAKPNKWQQALEVLSTLNLPVRNSEMAPNDILNSYALNKLKAEGWIKPLELEALPAGGKPEFAPEAIHTLNAEQEKVFEVINEKLNAHEYSVFLLNGITGSGKTEIYIHALKRALESGKGGMVLVPEIALTPQTVARFYKIFGEQIAVLHSRLSPQERLAAWLDLKNGTKKIAVGPRSAVFAPVQNLGMIILDEEHDASYKQEEPAPRYHARETAVMRAVNNNAVLVLGSATPSMQALHMAAKGKSTYLELQNRHAGASLPEVKVIDLKQYKQAMRGSLSAALFEAVSEALKNHEQIILLHNRRGFAGYLQCEDCGHIPQSPECSVSLTYHKHRNILLCHYSGYSRKADTQCEQCGSRNLVAKGTGTQRIEEELGVLFPEAEILRFDSDSTARKGAYRQILESFGNGKADILVGTQLVAKGLDFPNVTVVGVINADTELAFPSFQSGERMFQLLSQVAGRSGRAAKPGRVFIQTWNPDNPAIQFAARHDYKGFAKEELKFRKALNYPPYSRLIRFEVKGADNADAESSAHLLTDIIKKIMPKAEVLGPSPAAIAWKNRNYFWEVILKVGTSKGGQYMETLMDRITRMYEKEAQPGASRVRINIIVDSIR